MLGEGGGGVLGEVCEDVAEEGLGGVAFEGFALVFEGEVKVDLGRGQAAMAEELLKGEELHAAVEGLGGEGVAEGMG